MRSSFVALPLHFLWVVLLSSAFYSHHASASTTTPLPTDEHGDYNGLDLIEWIRSHPDGIIHPSVRIGRERPGDPTSINGLFVSSAPDAKPIEKGDIIAQIPWSHMIHPGDKYSPSRFKSCRAIYKLAQELELGDKSSRAPYVRYLLSLPRGTMPGEWTEAGAAFLAEELLDDDELPPYEVMWRNTYDKSWVESCEGSMYDEMQQAAYWLTTSRDEDTLMVPIYDMANHSNDPKKLNTLSEKSKGPGRPFLFEASRKIMPGEQIYNSYNRCNSCSPKENFRECETFSHYYTPHLFASFGFVEDYPQSWHLGPRDGDDDSRDAYDDESGFEFCLSRDDETGELDAYWDEDEMPDERDAAWLKTQLKRLKKLEGKKEGLEKELVRVDEGGDDKDKKMTRWEWESIWRYHQSLSFAIDAAIRTYEAGDVSSEDGPGRASYGMDDGSSEDESEDHDEL